MSRIPTSLETVEAVKTAAKENPSWGSPRIAGLVNERGFEISPPTVLSILKACGWKRAPSLRSPTAKHELSAGELQSETRRQLVVLKPFAQEYDDEAIFGFTTLTGPGRVPVRYCYLLIVAPPQFALRAYAVIQTKQAGNWTTEPLALPPAYVTRQRKLYVMTHASRCVLETLLQPGDRESIERLRKDVKTKRRFLAVFRRHIRQNFAVKNWPRDESHLNPVRANLAVWIKQWNATMGGH